MSDSIISTLNNEPRPLPIINVPLSNYSDNFFIIRLNFTEVNDPDLIILPIVLDKSSYSSCRRHLIDAYKSSFDITSSYDFNHFKKTGQLLEEKDNAGNKLVDRKFNANFFGHSFLTYAKSQYECPEKYEYYMKVLEFKKGKNEIELNYLVKVYENSEMKNFLDEIGDVVDILLELDQPIEI
jgi:hypothetical protein